MSEEETYTEEDREFFRSMGGTRRRAAREDVEIWDFGETPEDEMPAMRDDAPKIPEFSVVHKKLKETGAGKVRLLYQAANRVFGRDLDIGPQRWKDCVSWGFSGAIDLRACVEVEEGGGETYHWAGRVCTEVVQALAAFEYGWPGGNGTNSRRGAVAVREGGTLSRKLLGTYSGRRAEEWATSGLPNEYEDDARKHRARDVSRIRSFDEARDAIFNGMPIAIGSSQAFLNRGRRNSEGFATASVNKQWWHCMKFVAMRDDAQPGLLCLNSWSPNKGPKGDFEDIPKGSFWVTKKTCERMFDIGAGFAVGNFEGYRAT